MRIISDAARVVVISYSWWAGLLGLAALILPEIAFKLWGIETDPYVLWWIAVGLSLFGLVGRLLIQTGGVWVNLTKIAATALVILALSVVAGRAASEADTLAIALPFIEQKEGMKTSAYLDIVGVPTICAGSTRGVKLGQRMTIEQCRALLRAEVIEYRAGLHRYFSAETKRHRLPAPRDAAFTSLAYNVGISAAGNSTATKRLNAGNVAGACEALTWWNKTGQRVVRGLVLRRAEERALCLREA